MPAQPPQPRTAASTFDRVAVDLRHRAFAEMADAMRARTGRILDRWREQTLHAMPELSVLTLGEFRNSIPVLLGAVADALRSDDPLALRGVVDRASVHGADRFTRKHSLLDLFEEVRILRGVVVEELADAMRRPLTTAEAATFHAIFDLLIQQGVMALVDAQARELRDVQEMTRAANAQLLVSAAHQHELTEAAENAREAQRESEERFRTLFDLGPVAIYSIDTAGIIQNYNRQAARLWGREPAKGDSEERFCGSFRLLLPDGTVVPRDRCPMAEVLRGRLAEVRDREVVLERPDGSRITIVMNIRALRNSRGEITGAVNCFYDISDRVALEHRIRQQADALSAESRRKDEFLAMLSHELRNPLAPIRASVHLLKTQGGGSESLIQRQAREIIERQTGTLTKLVSDLLEVSRVVSGRIRLDLQVLDARRVVAHAAETARPGVEQHRHTLSLRLPDRAVWVHADATRLEEIMVNLLNNAVKYTPDGGRIEVDCAPAGGAAELRVRDSGVGIDRDLLEEGRLFDLFTQADRSLARSAGGLGIGLSLAHRLVRLHGGTIEARSPPEGADRGSEFIVRLPLAPAPGVPEPPAATGGDRGRPEGLRVLLVDDNADLVTMLSDALRHGGYSVQAARDGPEGLGMAQLWRPDVVLLDIGLPGLDGYEVARRLRSDPTLGGPGGPMRIIAMTGYGRDSDLARAREAGFDAHLIKPFEFAELQRIIGGVTGAPRSPLAPLALKESGE